MSIPNHGMGGSSSGPNLGLGWSAASWPWSSAPELEAILRLLGQGSLLVHVCKQEIHLYHKHRDKIELSISSFPHNFHNIS